MEFECEQGGLVQRSELWVLGKREILAVGTSGEDYEFQQITRKRVAKSLASLYVFPSVCSSPLFSLFNSTSFPPFVSDLSFSSL